MAETFDAYREWLDIPPERQPPNYYDLVGTELFTEDMDVIAQSADRQVKKLQERSATYFEDESIADRLLERIETARECLLDPDKKRPYDEKLRVRHRSRGTSSSVPEKSSPPPSIPKKASKAKPTPTVPSASTESKRSGSRFLLLAVGGSFGLIISVVFLTWNFLAAVPSSKSVTESEIRVGESNPQTAAVESQAIEMASDSARRDPNEVPPVAGLVGTGSDANLSHPISIAKTFPANPMAGGDFQVFLKLNDPVVRVSYRLQPADAWLSVDLQPKLAPRNSGAFGGGFDSPATFTSSIANSDGPILPSLQLTNLATGELKLEIQGFDKDDRIVTTVEAVYKVEPNPWEGLRQIAVLSHSAPLSRVRFAPNNNLLALVGPFENVARQADADDNKSLLARQVIEQRAGGLAPVTQCVLWKSENWSLASETSIFGLAGTEFDTSGELLVARTQRSSPMETTQESILWDNSKTSSTLIENVNRPMAFAVGPKGALVAVASLDSVRVLHSGHGELFHSFDRGNATPPPRSRGFSKLRDGNAVIEFGGGTPGEVPLDAHSHSLAFSEDGQLLVLSDAETQQIIVWNLPEKKRLQSLAATPICLAVHGATESLALGTKGNHQVWSVSSGKLVWEMPGESSAITFSPQGDWLAVGTQNKIVLRRAKDGYQCRELVGHDGLITALAFSADGKLLASGARDKTVRVWQVTTESDPTTSQTAPKLLSSHLLYVDQLIAQRQFGKALDVLPLVFHAPKNVAETSGVDQLFSGVAEFESLSEIPGAIRRGQPKSAAAESFTQWLEERRFKTAQERLDLVDKEQLPADLLDRFHQIVKSLAMIMQQEADSALEIATQQKGQEKLQAEFSVFRDFPAALLPKSFADEQQRLHVARRDNARKILQKFAGKGSKKLKSEDRNSLERVANLEFFLPEEASRAKALLGLK